MAFCGDFALFLSGLSLLVSRQRATMDAVSWSQSCLVCQAFQMWWPGGAVWRNSHENSLF